MKDGMSRERAEAIARAPWCYASADVTAALVWALAEASMLRCLVCTYQQREQEALEGKGDGAASRFGGGAR